MKISENQRLCYMKFPPENFESLKQFLTLLKHGEIQLDVGKKSLAALQTMIENPDTVATSNIVELSSFVNISAASLTRLAKLLGFQGYNYFRQIFKQSASLKTDYYSQQAQGIVNYSNLLPKEFIQSQLQSASTNIEKCLENIDNTHLIEIVKLLAIKRKIHIFGHQQCSAVASILRYGLSLIRNNVHLLGPSEQGLATAVGQMQMGELLVIISSAPYSKLAIDIATLANKQGCPIFAITDSKLSPLHDHAKVAINIPSAGHYFSNSLAAHCVIVESLLSLTALELGDLALEKLKHHEQILSQLKVNT